MPDVPFKVICEIEPATRPDLRRVRHQIGVLTSVASDFLIPDNHLGRATVSSVAVAHEVEAMGGHSIACLNCRDRNLLGLRRDLLTAAAYGVDEFLCVYGDNPTSGGRTSQLTVRAMIEEIHGWGNEGAVPDGRPFRAGVATRLGPVPQWKHDADFMFVQVSFSAEALVAWRESVAFLKPVYPGVIVLASPAMAESVSAGLSVEIPSALRDRLEEDRSAGVEAACQLVLDLRDSGAFEGVHLIPVGRYREVAARLEVLLSR
ncbi:MAG: methylenetetrahydrofolate reductase [Acidimicrobiales bacterium]|jgi:5,10-methylenetetrahydrofolate reductase